MPRMNVLMREALESCRTRGHIMNPFTKLSTTRFITQCKACGKYVLITSRPSPNEINIGGTAVALNCMDKET